MLSDLNKYLQASSVLSLLSLWISTAQAKQVGKHLDLDLSIAIYRSSPSKAKTGCLTIETIGSSRVPVNSRYQVTFLNTLATLRTWKAISTISAVQVYLLDALESGRRCACCVEDLMQTQLPGEGICGTRMACVTRGGRYGLSLEAKETS